MAVFTCSYKAKCKDCNHFGYYYPKNKNGDSSKRSRTVCTLKHCHVCKKDGVCDSWTINWCGKPKYLGKDFVV